MFSKINVRNVLSILRFILSLLPFKKRMKYTTYRFICIQNFNSMKILDDIMSEIQRIKTENIRFVSIHHNH